MPENKRSLQRYKRSFVLRNNSRRVVRNRTMSRDRGGVREATRPTNQRFAALHGLQDRVRTFLPAGEELYADGFWAHAIQQNLHFKEILLDLLLNSRGTESQ